MSIESNLSEIRQNIARAAVKSGRKPEDITLVGVTKTVDVGRISEIMDLGVTQLGENRVQELLEKYDVLSNRNPDWHLIGHLQTNKVKYIVDKVCMIHSVDSLSLAEEINKRSEKLGKIMDILIEINIAGEISKHGINPDEAVKFAKELQKFPFISIRGIMTVAPFVEVSEQNRENFCKMRNILIDIIDETSNNDRVNILSMGMTNDYEIAIEEGSTAVRIGTGIFGGR